MPEESFTAKPGTLKIGGLSRKAQKLQALREKAAAQAGGANPKSHASSNDSFKSKGNLAGHKKTAFNRKAV